MGARQYLIFRSAGWASASAAGAPGTRVAARRIHSHPNGFTSTTLVAPMPSRNTNRNAMSFFIIDL